MQHAVDTNRRDRAQKTSRREKFKGNHSDKTILSSENEHEFPQLPSDQITKERQRIAHVMQRKKKKDLITFVVAGTITITLLVMFYRSLFG